MAEIRLDMCNLTADLIISLFSSHPNLIATFRKKDRLSEKERQEFLKLAIENGAAYVDLDYNDDTEILSELRYAIDENNVKLIISYHDHEKTPPLEFIQDVICKIATCDPDLIKLAFMSNSEEDNLIVLQLYNSYDNLLAFNMGEKGKITRVASLKLGAPFTYVCKTGKTTAEGQMSLEEMKLYSRKAIARLLSVNTALKFKNNQ